MTRRCFFAAAGLSAAASAAGAAERAGEVAKSGINRYDWISTVGRNPRLLHGPDYDWDAMLATGRNVYGNPDQCIRMVQVGILDEDEAFALAEQGGVPPMPRSPAHDVIAPIRQEKNGSRARAVGRADQEDVLPGDQGGQDQVDLVVPLDEGGGHLPAGGGELGLHGTRFGLESLHSFSPP